MGDLAVDKTVTLKQINKQGVVEQIGFKRFRRDSGRGFLNKMEFYKRRTIF